MGQNSRMKYSLDNFYSPNHPHNHLPMPNGQCVGSLKQSQTNHGLPQPVVATAAPEVNTDDITATEAAKQNASSINTTATHRHWVPSAVIELRPP